MHSPSISIVIATLNSEKTLPLVLASIAKQTFPRNKIEIIVSDGGSQDKTVEIAKKAGCRVIKNPKIEPVYGKLLALLASKGKYLMFLDSDEVIESSGCIKKRIEIFYNNPTVKAIFGSGYKKPASFPNINLYINEFGDPFSLFMYGDTKDSRYFLRNLIHKYRTAKNDRNCVIFDFTSEKKLPFFELSAMGATIDRTFVIDEYPEIKKNQTLIPHLFYLITARGGKFAVSKNDVLIHYSASSLHKYLKKISTRVRSNIYYPKTMGASGFGGREKYFDGGMKFKKYLFIPYSLSLIFPIMDSLRLALTRKKIIYLLHFPLSLYTSFLIFCYSTLKLLGIRKEVKGYGI